MLIDIDSGIITDTVGNKAKFLMLMKGKGFQVPGGFILDKNTYKEIISHNKKEEQISKILSGLTADNISVSSTKLSSLFENISIPENIKSQVASKIKADTKYAVRSSGIKEDLEQFSFAGQYSTFLEIEELSAVLNSIVECYKSLFSETVLSYFVNNKINTANPEMAVIVQEMVDSDKSGIMFTVNPLTGKDKEIIIEIAEGLGENIVSGKVVPERYAYDWFEGKFEYDSQNHLLSAAKLTELSKIALDIQMFFGYPCDIEFAISNENIFILQARPITKIMYSAIPDQWSTADFKDGGVSATVCTPYMWSLYEYIWETVLKKFMLRSKILKARDLRKLGDMFYGRPYWNLSVVKTAMAAVPGYKEREFDSEFGVKITYEGNGKTTKISPKSLFGIIRMAIAQKKIVNERFINAQELKSDLLKKYRYYIDLYPNNYTLSEFEAIWYKLVKDDYLLSEGTYFWQIFINTIHQSLFKDKLLKYVSASEYFNLIGGLDNISHLLPFYDMWDISRKIAASEESSSFWRNNDILLIRSLYDSGSSRYFISELKEYIKTYGYHSEKELDVTYPCYFEDVNSVIKLFKETVMLDDSCSPATDRKKQSDIYKKQLGAISQKVSPRKFEAIAKNVEKMRNMLWWREEFRDVSTRFYYIIRIYTIKLAQLYKNEGILHNPDDIWYTKIEDLWNYIDKKITSAELNAIIARNKKYYSSFKNFQSENEIGSVFDRESTEPPKTSNIISGIGCNNGIVTGTARVIESLSEIDRLQVGDILITKFTDTGWTSKFAILKGIVTEYGGILCHAAIVSREYGIPCVVCAHNAVKLIKDGSTVRINGSTGEISIIGI